MPENIDPGTRIAKLKSLGLADKYPDLVAIVDAERRADLEIAEIEAERAAAREARRQAEEPIVIPWSATPSAADELVLLCPERRPISFGSVEINGKHYVPELASRTIGFLPASMRSAFRETSGFGWSFGSVRSSVFILEALGAADASSVVSRLASDAVPLLICIYRAHANSQRPEARSIAARAQTLLVQYAHAPSNGSYVPSGERETYQADEVAADRIWEMATADAPAVVELDSETEQRRAASEKTRVSIKRARRHRDPNHLEDQSANAITESNLVFDSRGKSLRGRHAGRRLSELRETAG